MFDLHISEALLLESVRANSDRSTIEDLLQRPDFDWDSFWSLAALQQVQPLVARTLADASFAELVSPEAKLAMKAARMQIMLSNMAIHAELQAINTRLQEYGIPMVPLKGTQLAQRLFGSLDARRCGDIDILVPEGHWDAAHRILVDVGYRPAAGVRPGVERHRFHGVPLIRAANGQAFMVEIHRQLTDPRFMTIDYGKLWKNRALVDTQPGTLAGLPVEELLVFLAIHAPKHDTGILRLLADIDHLVNRDGQMIDWDHVVSLSKAWHADAILYFMLTLSSTLLKTSVPDIVLKRIRPSIWKRHAVPFLVGPQTILRPPATLHLRTNRFRIAYCLMLQRNRRVMHSYWHYIIMPPRIAPENAIIAMTQSARRPFDGLAWTALSVGSAIRDRFRSEATAQS